MQHQDAYSVTHMHVKGSWILLGHVFHYFLIIVT